MQLCIILGTRPEIIKLSSIIRYCESNKVGYFIIHTNQHFSKEMDSIFFRELDLPEPKYNLNIHEYSHGVMVGKMLIKIEKILLDEKPDVVLVQGDTNSVLAGALCAVKLGIKIGHVEAGLRSYDNKMPEEINRIITDRISDYLFCPGNLQRNILIKEGIPKEKIFVVGNTITDAIRQNIQIAAQKIKRPYRDKSYFLLTLHRQENTDDKKRLINIFIALEKICSQYKTKIIFPIHPRTKNRIKQFKLRIPKGVKITGPLGYLKFLILQKNAKLILTDSGGIQEEACILKVPCVTLRDNTERPETMYCGANIVTGNAPSDIVKAAAKIINQAISWKHPFGNGDSGETIIKIIVSQLYPRTSPANMKTQGGASPANMKTQGGASPANLKTQGGTVRGSAPQNPEIEEAAPPKARRGSTQMQNEVIG